MEQVELNQDNINHQDEILFEADGGWLKIKKCSNHNYVYAERKGVDSVAFVLFDKNQNNTKRFGVVRELKPSIDKMMPTAFGGSIDKEYYKQDLRVLVKEEVMEESGFDVELQDIKFYDRILVSTQMNQFCYLFAVSVDRNKQQDKTTTNPAELLAEVIWLDLGEVAALQDWKAITIIAKRLTSSDTKITLKPIVQ